MTKPKSKVITVHVTGPLAPYAQQFRSLLTQRGYTPLTRVSQLQVVVHLSKWLRRVSLTPGISRPRGLTNIWRNAGLTATPRSAHGQA